MTAILSTLITTAVSASVTTPVQFRDGRPESAAIQAAFVYGSGGTSVDIWVQTSLDGGTTWIDVCQFSFATTTAVKDYNLSALTPKTTAVVPTDGTMSANTSLDGILGSLWRCKYTTVGTYATTTLRVDIIAG